MKKYILASCLALSCSGNGNIHNMPEPLITSSVITESAESTATQTPATIAWQSFDEKTKLMLEETGLCALILFNSKVLEHDSCTKMEQSLQDPEVVSLVNDAFVPIRFPVDECLKSAECIKILRDELMVDKLPTTILVFQGEDSPSLYAVGYLDVNEFKRFLTHNTDQYNACKLLKGKENE